MDWRLAAGRKNESNLRMPTSRPGSNSKLYRDKLILRSSEKQDYQYGLSPVALKTDHMLGISTMEEQPSVRPDSLRRRDGRAGQQQGWHQQEQSHVRQSVLNSMPRDAIKLEEGFYPPKSYERDCCLDLLVNSAVYDPAWNYDQFQQSILRGFNENLSTTEWEPQSKIDLRSRKKSLKKTAPKKRPKQMDSRQITAFDTDSIKDFEGSVKSGCASALKSRPQTLTKKFGADKGSKPIVQNGTSGLKLVFKGNKDFAGHNKDDTPSQESGFLGKRKVGRPKGSASKKRTPPHSDRKSQMRMVTVIDTSLGSRDFNNFDSDGEFQELDLKPEEVESDLFECKFSEPSSMTKVEKQNAQSARNEPFALNFGKIIASVNKVRVSDTQAHFVCRYCARIFKKASSLGGHTAKMHQGMSLKYKNRLSASRNRGPERNRVKFLKNMGADI